MTTVVWIPNLRGTQSLYSEFTAPAFGQSDEDIIRDYAVSEGCAFRRIDYQPPENPPHLFSEMSVLVARKLAGLIDFHREPFVVVSSSFSTGITLGALTRLKQTVSPIVLMAIKPVFDPLTAIEQQIRDVNSLEQLKSGKVPALPFVIEGDKKNQFSVTKHHLADKDALRVFNLLSDDVSARRFSLDLINSGIKEISLIYKDPDPLTPKTLVDTFHDEVHYISMCKRRLHSNQNGEFRRVLREELDNLIALANDFS